VNVSCPECRSVFRVDPTKLPTTTVRARCSVCGGVITISAGSSIDEEFSANAATSRQPAQSVGEASAGQRGNAGIATALLDSFAPPSPRAATPIPLVAAVPSAPQSRSLTPPASRPAPVNKPLNSSPAPAPSGGTRPVLFPPRPMMPGNAAPAGTGGLTARPIVAPRPGAAAPPATPSPVRRPEGAPTAGPVANGPSAASNTTALNAAAAKIAATSPGAPAGSSPAPRPAAAPPTATSVGSPAPPRSPINPFLANDPHAKAKRLARALVSDLITYFPQKRQDGLRDGTLKQLFKDEIQKSY